MGAYCVIAIDFNEDFSVSSSFCSNPQSINSSFWILLSFSGFKLFILTLDFSKDKVVRLLIELRKLKLSDEQSTSLNLKVSRLCICISFSISFCPHDLSRIISRTGISLSISSTSATAFFSFFISIISLFGGS